jgi:hypothetical protein
MGKQLQSECKIGSYAPRTSSTYQSWTSRRSEGRSRSRPQRSAWCNILPLPVKKIRTFTSKRSFNFVKHSTWTGWLNIKWGQRSFRSRYSGRLFAMVLLSTGKDGENLGHLDEGLHEGILLVG